MVALACFCHTALAKPDKNEQVKTDPVVAPAPSLDFLEYLAEMENVNGAWVSPVDMLDKNDSILTAVEQPKEDKLIIKEAYKGDAKTIKQGKDGNSSDNEVEQ